jgi:hypothetical protein
MGRTILTMEAEVLEKNLSLCHLVHLKSYKKWRLTGDRKTIKTLKL